MKKIIVLAVGMIWCVGIQAQQIDAVLQQIEQNNKELQAQQQLTAAAKMEVRTQNNLEDPKVSYSPSFGKGIDGVASSEMVVSMGFDFPTLYASRHQAGNLQRVYLDRQQQMVRRTILLQAKTLCLDLIRLNQEHELLLERSKNAQALLDLLKND